MNRAARYDIALSIEYDRVTIHDSFIRREETQFPSFSWRRLARELFSRAHGKGKLVRKLPRVRAPKSGRGARKARSNRALAILLHATLRSALGARDGRPSSSGETLAGNAFSSSGLSVCPAAIEIRRSSGTRPRFEARVNGAWYKRDTGKIFRG